MSEYSLLNQEFHAFSKSPIKGDQRLFNSVNKSGHTVTTSEIWSDDIPWFTEVSTEKNAIERAKDARYNDIILLNSTVYKRLGDKTNGASTGTTFGELWEVYGELNTARSYAIKITEGGEPTITQDKVEIKNSNDDVVVEYYVGYPIDLLTFENNSNQASLSAARMFIADANGNKEVVEQFVSSTDKIYKGFPSTGYNVLVYTKIGDENYTKIIEGETDDDFINNAYSGIVQFNKDRDKTHQFAASIYKYVGKKLTKSIKDFDDALTEVNNTLTTVNNSITTIKQNPIELAEGTAISITPSTTTDGTKKYTIACTYEFDTDWFTVTGTKVSIKKTKLDQAIDTAFQAAINDIEVEVTTGGLIDTVTNGKGQLRNVAATTNLNVSLTDPTALIDTEVGVPVNTVSETGEVITKLVDLNSL